VFHAALSSILGIHLALWLECSVAAAMVVMGALLFVAAWIFSPRTGLIARRFAGRVTDRVVPLEPNTRHGT